MALGNINLSELHWNTRGQWPRELKFLFFIMLGMSAFFLTYFLLVKPEFNEYDDLLNKQKTIKEDFEKKYDQTVNLATYIKQLAEMHARFGALIKELPSENQMPALLSDISRAGTNIGLTFVRFEPQKEILHTDYVELPVNIEVVGSYHQLSVFVSRVAQISRIITLHDFEIDYAQKETSETSDNVFNQEQLEMTMTIKIYRYRS